MTKREQRVIKAFLSCVESGEFTVEYAIVLIEDQSKYGWLSEEANEAFYEELPEEEPSSVSREAAATFPVGEGTSSVICFANATFPKGEGNGDDGATAAQEEGNGDDGATAAQEEGNGDAEEDAEVNGEGAEEDAEVNGEGAEEDMEAEGADGEPEEAVYAVGGGEAVKLEIPDDADGTGDTNDAEEAPEDAEYD